MIWAGSVAEGAMVAERFSFVPGVAFEGFGYEDGGFE